MSICIYMYTCVHVYTYTFMRGGKNPKMPLLLHKLSSVRTLAPPTNQKLADSCSAHQPEASALLAGRASAGGEPDAGRQTGDL